MSDTDMRRKWKKCTAWIVESKSVKVILDYTWRDGTLVKGNEKAHEQSWTVDNDNNSK